MSIRTSPRNSGSPKAAEGPEPAKQVQWEWEMYGGSAPVTVRIIEANKRIVIEWLGYSDLTTVEWKFASQKDGTTFVSITEASIESSGSQAYIMMT